MKYVCTYISSASLSRTLLAPSDTAAIWTFAQTKHSQHPRYPERYGLDDANVIRGRSGEIDICLADEV